MRLDEKLVVVPRQNLREVSLSPHEGMSLQLNLRRLEGWAKAQEAVQAHLKGLTPGSDRNLVQLAQGLKALDIPFDITANELANPTTTALLIGTQAKPFAIRYEGQHERLSELLREIDVPSPIRVRNLRTIGAHELTPEGIKDLHVNDTRLRYPVFFQAVEQAYMKSLKESDQRLTTSERLRTDRNLAAAERVSEYVDEFNHRRHDLARVSLRLQKHDSEPAILTAGAPTDSSPAHIVLARRAVLGQFGEFLKEAFLQR